MSIDEKLVEKNGVDKLYFYTVKTPIMNNTYTVCILYNTKEQRIEARGISICSLLDPFNFTKGKNKAFGRALKALKRKTNFYKINGNGRSDEVIRREIKIKNIEEDKRFLEELNSISCCVNILCDETPSHKFIKKYMIDLPLSYPIEIVNKNFKYKGQYRPSFPIGEHERRFVDEMMKCKE